MPSRVAKVEHVVKAEAALTRAPGEGRAGGWIEVPFHPFPGAGQVRVFIERIPTLGTRPATRGLSVRKRKRLFPLRPPFTGPDFGLNDEILGLDPVPYPMRIEIGRRGDATPEVFVAKGREVTTFSVPAFVIPGGPATDPNEDTDLARGAARPAGLKLPTDVPQWVCRVSNMGDSDVKCFVSVAFQVQRKLTVTRIPLERFEHIFQGGLRWLTPTLRAVNGDLVVSLSPEAIDTIGIQPERIGISGVDVTDAEAVISPVSFDVISHRRLVREAFEDLARHFAEAAFPAIVPEGFVDQMVDAALSRGGQGLEELATELLPDEDGLGRPLNVKGAFEDLDLNGSILRRPHPSDGEDVILRIRLALNDLHAAGSAVIGAAEVTVDSIESRLYVRLGQARGIELHPQHDQPRHAEEYLPYTHPTWESRFLTRVGDLDVDTELGGGPLGEALELVVDLAANHFDYVFSDTFEEAANRLVRDYLRNRDHAIKLAAEAGHVLMQIADRDRALHGFHVEGGQLVIEHFDPTDARGRPARPARRQPLLTPIDGAMDSDADARLGNIDHIVVVMMENRSFDHMLGYLSHPDAALRGGSRRRLDVDGLTGEEQIPHGGNVGGSPLTPAPDVQPEFRPDPNHNFAGVAEQVQGGAMDGFVPNFRATLARADEIEKSGRFDDERRILGFLTAPEMPVHHYMATEFGVLDRWFCSFPGGTYPNRMCQLAGTTSALTNRELFPDLGYLEPTTLFQMLRLAHVDWRHLEGDICFLRSFKAHRLDFERIRPLREWLDAEGDRLAPVTFIDPDMTGVPGEDHAADDHPPTAVEWGQAFLRRVLMRLRASPGWDNTLMIVTYDEHGGFYDHVAPPGTAPFHQRHPEVSTALSRVHPEAGMFGVRVPAFVVSPRIARGFVGHRIYDHASIIRTVLQRFAPDRITLMPERVRQARHLGELIGDARSTEPPPPLPERASALRMRASRGGSGLQLHKVREDADDARALLRRFGAPVRR